MQPAALRQTDAAFNTGCAVIAVQTVPEGVYVVMKGRVWNPDEAHKNMDLGRFEHAGQSAPGISE